MRVKVLAIWLGTYFVCEESLPLSIVSVHPCVSSSEVSRCGACCVCERKIAETHRARFLTIEEPETRGYALREWQTVHFDFRIVISCSLTIQEY